jgi:deoxyhypusine monooxygenase
VALVTSLACRRLPEHSRRRQPAPAQVLQDGGEHAMVRHEAAEALGAIADGRSVQLLTQYASDAEPIVAHSCIVALDMIEFEKSGRFEYADTGAAA